MKLSKLEEILDQMSRNVEDLRISANLSESQILNKINDTSVSDHNSSPNKNERGS